MVERRVYRPVVLTQGLFATSRDIWEYLETLSSEGEAVPALAGRSRGYCRTFYKAPQRRITQRKMSVVPRLGRTALEEEIGSEGRLHHLPVVWTWAIGISSLNLSVSSLTNGKKKKIYLTIMVMTKTGCFSTSKYVYTCSKTLPPSRKSRAFGVKMMWVLKFFKP